LELTLIVPSDSSAAPSTVGRIHRSVSLQGKAADHVHIPIKKAGLRKKIDL
jgi:hypothetical protein